MRIAQTTLLLEYVDNYTEFMQSTAVVIQKSQFHVDQASLRAPPVA